MEKKTNKSTQFEQDPRTSESEAVEKMGLDVAPLADLCTELWRLRAKMVDPKTHKPREEYRKLNRHLVSVLDILGNENVRIVDHTGQPFDPGMTLLVRSFQPLPGLKNLEVIETMKPSVYQNQHLIQPGEVIVGKPEEEETAKQKGGKEKWKE